MITLLTEFVGGGELEAGIETEPPVMLLLREDGVPEVPLEVVGIL